MPAPKGNNYKQKWKTSKERKKAFEDVCAHIRSGLSRESYPGADWDTVERYLKDYPEDFPSEKLEAAFREQMKRAHPALWHNSKYILST